jgi:hypothetical protein
MLSREQLETENSDKLVIDFYIINNYIPDPLLSHTEILLKYYYRYSFLFSV